VFAIVQIESYYVLITTPQLSMVFEKDDATSRRPHTPTWSTMCLLPCTPTCAASASSHLRLGEPGRQNMLAI